MKKETPEGYMTISQFIKALEKAMDEHGDIPVYMTQDGYCGSLDPDWWGVYEIDGRNGSFEALCILEI